MRVQKNTNGIEKAVNCVVQCGICEQWVRFVVHDLREEELKCNLVSTLTKSWETVSIWDWMKHRKTLRRVVYLYWALSSFQPFGLHLKDFSKGWELMFYSLVHEERCMVKKIMFVCVVDKILMRGEEKIKRYYLV